MRPALFAFALSVGSLTENDPDATGTGSGTLALTGESTVVSRRRRTVRRRAG